MKEQAPGKTRGRRDVNPERQRNDAAVSAFYKLLKSSMEGELFGQEGKVLKKQEIAERLSSRFSITGRKTIGSGEDRYKCGKTRQKNALRVIRKLGEQTTESSER
jgi:hypothetical protein